MGLVKDDKFEYGIKVKDKVIAWFANEHDRDICLDFLATEHADCAELFKEVNPD